MKGIKITLSIMLLYITIDCTAGTGWNKGKTVKFEAGISDVSQVTSLTIPCDPKSIALFSTMAGSFTGLKEVQLTGNDKKTDWNKVFEALNKAQGLKTVEFNSNGFVKMPEGINTLKAVSSLAVSDNDKLDLEDLATRLSDMENIKELKIEVYSVNNLPENISDMDGLEKLSIYNKEIIFGDEATEGQAEEQLKTESDFGITWYDDLDERKDIAVSYFSIGESISGADMNSITGLFPRTDLSVSTYAPKKNMWEIEKARWIKKYNFIKPPIKGVDVEKSYYSMNAVNGGNFTYSSGSRVSIPPMAFVTANGKPVTGDVTIDYREFKDQADILASGIPMTYDSGGVMNNFESAGMFEINASQNGSEVFLKKGKKISMDFTSNDDRSSMNLYAFNDTTGNWRILGKAGAIKKVSVDSWTYRDGAYEMFKRSMVYFRTRSFDSTLFADRFNSDLYWHTLRKGTAEKGKLFEFRKKKRQAWVVKTYGLRKSKEGKTRFKLKYDADRNPELNNFNTVVWETEEHISPNQFRKMFSYKNAYNDLRIVKDGDSYEMQFKSANGIQKIEVNAMTLDGNKKVVEIKDGGARFYKHYARSLRWRERRFNRDIKRGAEQTVRRNLKSKKDQERYAYNQAWKFMTPEEKKMSLDEWMANYEANMQKEKLSLDKYKPKEENIIRSFQVSGMGIFNCDQISRMQEPMTVKAIYKDSLKKYIGTKTSYVVQKNINAVFQYGAGMLGEGTKPTDISFDQKGENTILTINADGSIAVFTPDKFFGEQFGQGLRHTFAMDIPDAKVKNVGDLRKLMGLD